MNISVSHLTGPCLVPSDISQQLHSPKYRRPYNWEILIYASGSRPKTTKWFFSARGGGGGGAPNSAKGFLAEWFSGEGGYSLLSRKNPLSSFWWAPIYLSLFFTHLKMHIFATKLCVMRSNWKILHLAEKVTRPMVISVVTNISCRVYSFMICHLFMEIRIKMLPSDAPRLGLHISEPSACIWYNFKHTSWLISISKTSLISKLQIIPFLYCREAEKLNNF